jgi:hypothetical protein
VRGCRHWRRVRRRVTCTRAIGGATAIGTMVSCITVQVQGLQVMVHTIERLSLAMVTRRSCWRRDWHGNACVTGSTLWSCQQMWWRLRIHHRTTFQRYSRVPPHYGTSALSLPFWGLHTNMHNLYSDQETMSITTYDGTDTDTGAEIQTRVSCKFIRIYMVVQHGITRTVSSTTKWNRNTHCKNVFFFLLLVTRGTQKEVPWVNPFPHPSSAYFPLIHSCHLAILFSWIYVADNHMIPFASALVWIT